MNVFKQPCGRFLAVRDDQEVRGQQLGRVRRACLMRDTQQIGDEILRMRAATMKALITEIDAGIVGDASAVDTDHELFKRVL